MEKMKPSYIMSSKLEEFCKKNSSDTQDIVETMISESNMSLSDLWIDLNTPDNLAEEDLPEFYKLLVDKLDYICKEIMKKISKIEYEKFLLITSMKDVAETLVHSDMSDYENLGDNNTPDKIEEYLTVSVNKYQQYVEQYNDIFEQELELLSQFEKSSTILENVFKKNTDLEED
jgi:hypothetical protein